MENQPTITAAQLRQQAREAEACLNWALAAELYERTADSIHCHPGSQLHTRDIANLRARAADCRYSAGRN